MNKKYRYKVRIFFDFEMQDFGEEPDKHYAESEAFNKLKEEIGNLYTPEEVLEELQKVMQTRVECKLLSKNEYNPYDKKKIKR